MLGSVVQLPKLRLRYLLHYGFCLQTYLSDPNKHIVASVMRFLFYRKTHNLAIYNVSCETLLTLGSELANVSLIYSASNNITAL